ncbi:MAG: selenocysteine lyase [Moraxellaceae bacterium]|nr:MAG: selenocysteine lyase [Moraxellaceae bacterium]
METTLTKSFTISDIRHAFPILQESANEHPLIYFDNAATTQKPASVINAIDTYYSKQNANVHRASHHLSAIATQRFEHARATIQSLINAAHSHEIIWTKGTTESINLIAQSYGRSNLSAGDEILISLMEHHANIVPWQMLAEQTGAILKVIPLTLDNQLDLTEFDRLLSSNTKIVSICHVSNSLGTINPIKEIIEKAKTVNAVTVIDGAQAIAHLPVDVQALDCDFYCFSGHKMFGPTGIGVLYGKESLLNAMPPWQCGGEMIQRVSFSGTTFSHLPFKFEAGTPNIAGVIGLGAAVEFLQQLDREACRHHEEKLLAAAQQRAANLPSLELVAQSTNIIGLLAFNIRGYHASDVGTLLDQQGIAVRTGHHCTMPLMDHLNIDGSLRISFAFYNTIEEVHRCFDCLEKILAAPPSHTTTVTPVLPSIDELTVRLLASQGWESRYRVIMGLAKELPPYPENNRDDNHLVMGCDVTVWLSHQNRNGILSFSIDSNARIVKGLAMILLSYYNGKQASEILGSDIQGIFKKLGLNKHLSPSRTNGLRAINQKILKIAETESG